ICNARASQKRIRQKVTNSGEIMAIMDFRGEYKWLSNFWEEPIFTSYGVCYKSAEHAYQSEKAVTYEDYIYVKESPTPRIARQRGNKIKLREDWDNVKVQIMRIVLKDKFNNKSLAQKLIDT